MLIFNELFTSWSFILDKSSFFLDLYLIDIKLALQVNSSFLVICR